MLDIDLKEMEKARRKMLSFKSSVARDNYIRKMIKKGIYL